MTSAASSGEEKPVCVLLHKADYAHNAPRLHTRRDVDESERREAARRKVSFGDQSGQPAKGGPDERWLAVHF